MCVCVFVSVNREKNRRRQLNKDIKITWLDYRDIAGTMEYRETRHPFGFVVTRHVAYNLKSKIAEKHLVPLNEGMLDRMLDMVKSLR